VAVVSAKPFVSTVSRIEFLDLSSIQHSVATTPLDAVGIDGRSGENQFLEKKNTYR